MGSAGLLNLPGEVLEQVLWSVHIDDLRSVLMSSKDLRRAAMNPNLPQWSVLDPMTYAALRPSPAPLLPVAAQILDGASLRLIVRRCTRIRHLRLVAEHFRPPADGHLTEAAAGLGWLTSLHIGSRAALDPAATPPRRAFWPTSQSVIPLACSSSHALVELVLFGAVVRRGDLDCLAAGALPCVRYLAIGCVVDDIPAQGEEPRDLTTSAEVQCLRCLLAACPALEELNISSFPDGPGRRQGRPQRLADQRPSPGVVQLLGDAVRERRMRINLASPFRVGEVRVSCGVCCAAIYESLGAWFMARGVRRPHNFVLFAHEEPQRGRVRPAPAFGQDDWSRLQCPRRCQGDMWLVDARSGFVDVLGFPIAILCSHGTAGQGPTVHASPQTQCSPILCRVDAAPA